MMITLEVKGTRKEEWKAITFAKVHGHDQAFFGFNGDEASLRHDIEGSLQGIELDGADSIVRFEQWIVPFYDNHLEHEDTENVVIHERHDSSVLVFVPIKYMDYVHDISRFEHMVGKAYRFIGKELVEDPVEGG